MTTRTDFVPVGSENATRRLASFMTSDQRIPDEVLSAVGPQTLDTLGVAIGADSERSVAILGEVLDGLGGALQATAWTTGRRYSVAHAALANANSAHVLDFDDTYFSPETAFHVNAPVIAAALAIAEWKGSSGADYARAVVMGYEAMVRVARAGGRKHHSQRWLVTSTAGPFGAAAAAGTLLRLNEGQMAYALGIAGSDSGGLSEVLGTMSKGLNAGSAAMSGVIGALLAERGFTSAEDVLTGKFGFHAVFHSDQNVDALLGDLGERWEIKRAGLKPFACGSGLRALLGGVLQLRERHGIRPAGLKAIEITCSPHVLVVTGIREPATGLEGKFSVYHAAAVALVDGDAGMAQFSDDRVRAADVIAVREKVRVIPDESVRRDEARVSIVMDDGRSFAEHVMYAPGTPENPMSTEQLTRKFMALAQPVLGPAAEQVRRAALTVESLPNIEPLVVPLRRAAEQQSSR